MEPTSAIVVVVDRLGAGHLGPYGNTWLETPHFNRLAARSLLVETVLADTPDLDAACRGYWTGRHALEPAVGAADSLSARGARYGTRTLLVTDEAAVADHPLATGFGQRLLIDSPEPIRSADEIEQTGMFRLIAAALEAIEQHAGPVLAWIHARGMSGAWDAPLEFRNALADEEDPPPPKLIAPPERRLERGFDPDDVLGFLHAYAGQVQLVDACLGLLLDALEQRLKRGETLLAVTSPRGYPLGEHGRIGPCDEALYSELIQVPLVVQFPRREGRLTRSGRLAQPCDLMPTILDACGWGPWEAGQFSSSLLREVRGESSARREAVCAVGPRERVIRTPAWLLRESRAGDELQHELFAKPDDRWEANEVSSRCSEVVSLLAAELDRFEEAARAGKLAELAPLAEILCDVWR